MVRMEKKKVGASPSLFIAIVAGVVFLVFLVPSFAGLLVYDREEIAAGQVWRLFTGSLVHFSPSHLLLNLVVFVITGGAIAFRRYRGFGLFCVLSAGLIGAALYASFPDMVQYGGLSGVACGAVVYLALHGLSERGVWRFLCVGALMLTTCKILVECGLGQFLFVNGSDGAFVPAPLSHAVGSLTAVIVFLFVKAPKGLCLIPTKEGENESNCV